MPPPNDPLTIYTLARALGWSADDLAALPDFVLAFCFELLTHGPEAGQ